MNGTAGYLLRMRRRLDAENRRLLALLRAGRTLDEALDVLDGANREPGFAVRVSSALRTHAPGRIRG
jgi:hypothetical protein